MEHGRSQFTFYASFYDALKELPKRQQAEVFLAICAYALDGEQPELTGTARCCFLLMKPVLDAAEKRSSASRGTRKEKELKKIKPESNANQMHIKPESNANQTRIKTESNANQTGAKRKQTENKKKKEKENEIEIENKTENDCSAGAVPVEEIVHLYEKLCPSMPGCAYLSAATRKAMEDRFREHGDLSVFEGLFRRAGESDFLSGRVGSWRASLDWLLEEGHFAKVLNGCYDNRPDPRAVPKGASGQLGAAELEAIARVLREEVHDSDCL